MERLLLVLLAGTLFALAACSPEGATALPPAADAAAPARTETATFALG